MRDYNNSTTVADVKVPKSAFAVRKLFFFIFIY